MHIRSDGGPLHSSDTPFWLQATASSAAPFVQEALLDDTVDTAPAELTSLSASQKDLQVSELTLLACCQLQSSQQRFCNLLKQLHSTARSPPTLHGN